jgi:hypothetical protein
MIILQTMELSNMKKLKNYEKYKYFKLKIINFF